MVPRDASDRPSTAADKLTNRLSERAWQPSLTRLSSGGLPGRTRTAHATREVGIAEVRVRGDPHQIKAWLGAHQVPIDIRPGPSAITAVVVISASGDEIVLDTTES
jgi:hypothetical protein